MIVDQLPLVVAVASIAPVPPPSLAFKVIVFVPLAKTSFSKPLTPVAVAKLKVPAVVSVNWSATPVEPSTLSTAVMSATAPETMSALAVPM